MRRRMAFTLALALTGCGGGGSSILPAGSTNAPGVPAQTKQVTIALVIPLAPAPPSSRKPAFISPAAKGALVDVSGSHGGSGSAVADISATSPTCTTTGGQRTCPVTIGVPFDSDVFTVQLYDTAPVNNAIPAGAHLLGTGSLSQTVTPSFTGTLNLFVGGEISSIGLGSAFVSVLPNGNAQSIGITIAPTDFGNKAIVTGANDPFANPIRVSLQENGGAGHMHLVMNGSAAGTSATLSQSTDTVSIAYDGGGSAGYNATVTLSATGASTQTMQVSPMFVSSTSPLFSGSVASLNGPIASLPIEVSEANAPSTTTYAIAMNGCTNIASVGTITQANGIANFSLSGGTTPSASGCSVTISDGIINSVLAVENSPTGGTVPLPGWSITEFQARPTPSSSAPASPGALALGPDGRMWFTDVLNGGVGAMTTHGTVSNYSGPYYANLLAGPNGMIWATQSSNPVLDELSPSTGAVVKRIATTFTPNGMALGPDGDIWVTEGYFNGPISVAQISSSGAVLQEVMVSVAASPDVQGIVSAPDHTMWFCDNNNSQIDNVTTTTPSTASAIVSLGGAGCANLANGNDGNVWVSGNSAGVLVIDPNTKTVVHTIPLTHTLSQFSSILQGPDNAMYVTEDSSNVIARIDETTYAPAEYNAPTATAFLRGAALGGDGRIWFTENNTNQLGALTP